MHIHVYLPIIWSTDDQNKTSSPEDFEFMRFDCIGTNHELVGTKKWSNPVGI